MALVLVNGCSTHRLTEQQRAELYSDYLNNNKVEEVERVTSFRFHGWRELGKKHLIVSKSMNRPYFLTLKNNCIELGFSQSIGINRSGSTLHAKFDSIFVPSFPEQRCFIKSIHKLTREQADAISDLGKEKEGPVEEKLNKVIEGEGGQPSTEASNAD